MKEFFKVKSNFILTGITVLFSIVNLWLIFNKSPMVAEQEWAQKIFYYHVPLAWNFFIAYLITMLELNAFDNIVHEHLEYYSLKSLKNLLESKLQQR